MLTVLQEAEEKVLSLDDKLITYWEDLINSGIITNDMLTFNPLTPQLRWKWRMNLRGLLIAEFNIPEIYVYPNIRINNISNYDFKSDKALEFEGIYIIDSSFLEKAYEDYLIKYKK